MDPWSTTPTVAKDQKTKDPSLHQILASTARLSSSGSTTGAASSTGGSRGDTGSKRVVCPAVPFMTVKEERKCLSEIRNYVGPIPENYVLSNGMKAEDFALMYVLGHQLKRKEKQSSTNP